MTVTMNRKRSTPTPACLTPGLYAQLQAQAASARAGTTPPPRLPFLVTLTPNAQPTDLLPFKPDVWIAATHLACGSMTAQDALELANRAGVVRMEVDGVARALGDSD
jgi:hypothetical protein